MPSAAYVLRFIHIMEIGQNKTTVRMSDLGWLPFGIESFRDSSFRASSKFKGLSAGKEGLALTSLNS